MTKPGPRRRRLTLLAGPASGLTLAVTLALTVAAPASAGAPPAPGSGRAGVLRGVSDVSPQLAWAVGYSCVSNCGFGAGEVDHTLILRWNGAAWTRLASPDPDHNGRLDAVSAASPSAAWAVGSYCTARCGTGSAEFHALTLRWNGAAWARVTSPSPAGARITGLNGVSATSAGAAWAVGTYCSVNCGQTQSSPPPRPQTLTLRWNGTRWQRVASPDPGGRYGSSLYGVSALPSGGAWAVGNYGTQQSFQNFTPGNSLVLHWNGHAWARQPSPSFGQPAPGSVLSGVSARSATAALSAGSSYFGDCECARTLAVRWNGTGWAKVASPSPGPAGDPVTEFLGISAVSASDAWAAGYWESQARSSSLTLLARWNGTSWARVPSPDDPAGLAGGGNFLNAVSARSATGAWAAGYYVTSGGDSRTLILRWDGTRWERA